MPWLLARASTLPLPDMTEAAGLIEWCKGAEGSDGATSVAELHQRIYSFTPEWENYEATRVYAGILKLLELGVPATRNKNVLEGQLPVLQACVAALGKDEKPAQWLLTLFYDMLREDCSCFSVFEEALKQHVEIDKTIIDVLSRSSVDSYVADKAAWLLSSLMGNSPQFFSEDQVKALTSKLQENSQTFSELGALEAVVNLLKADSFRSLVWAQPGVSDLIFRVQPRNASAPHLYKAVFALWMLSYDSRITAELKNFAVIKKLRDILAVSRVEKVIRLSLTVLKNFLNCKALCEDIVEEGLLEAVQQLEFEKWRDSELYDEIRDTVQLISVEVNEMSNFERYERELQTGKLSWGFIHSNKFWADNVLKFEQNDFRALKVLAGLLHGGSTDSETLAVACHDLGEFVALHPLGKKKVAQLHVKEKVMQLMGSQDPAHREVRREALLCCQKLMLNKWQDMEVAK